MNGPRYPSITNYIVYARIEQQGNKRWPELRQVGSALTKGPEAALEEVARRENLMPGKFVVIDSNFDTIHTGTVTHRVVMDV
jgi:hypothetical protein